MSDEEQGAGTHPTLDDLVERASDPGIQRHLAECPECRIAARVFAEAGAADPATLPEFDEARVRLEAAQREASVSLSRSLGATAGDFGDELKPGQVVERYTVEALLGKGGMGSVYRVRHNRLGSVHALKVLQFASRSVRSRLIREGRAQSGLRHPNVVAVTDVIEVEGAPGLIMEFVDGPSLQEWLLEHGRPSIWEADALAEGIIRGLGAAHRARLVHRDLKPANILLAKGEEGIVPKIADFGLARFMELQSTDTHLTRADAPMGTPSYMAPEQITDARRADARSDLFSLGAVLYELVTARRAFGGTDVVDIYNRVRAGTYTPLRELVPDLPDRMARTIERALQVDPARRYDDCGALLVSWSDAAVAPSSGAPSVPAPGRNRRWWLASAGVLALAAAAVVVAWWPRRGPEPSYPPPAPTERRLTNVGFYNPIAWFTLSPDGRRIAWCAADDGGGGRSAQMVLDEGTPPSPLIADEPWLCALDYFSDSERVLVATKRPVAPVDRDTPLTRVPFALWVVGGDGSVEPLPEGVNVGPEDTAYNELSPDDRLLAYSGVAGPAVYSFDTLTATRLRSLAVTDFTRAMVWSPSGEYLAAIHSNNEEAWLEITASDGSSTRRVLTDARLGTVSPANANFNPPMWGANLAWLEPDTLVYGLVDDGVSPMQTTLYAVDHASTATDFAGAPVFERLVGGYIMDLEASTDGSRIAFRRQEAQSDIWLVPLDRPEAASQLSEDDWDELPLGWNASGEVVYASDHQGEQDLYAMSPEAGRPKHLTGDPAREWPGDVHGDAVLWWRAETDSTGAETGQILVRAIAEGEAASLLRVDPGHYSVRCPLTPERPCLVARRAAASTEFYRLDPDASALGPPLLALSIGPGVTGWDVSPDGERVAVVTNLPAELVIRDVESGGVVMRPLAPVNPQELAWAPSGDRLFLSGTSLDPERGTRVSRVWSVGLDGAMELVWTLPSRVLSDPTPSPDGKFLAVRVTDFASADLWLLDRAPGAE